MTRSASATYPQKIACLIWLAAEGGHPFMCAECGRPILPAQAVQFDHRQAVSRGGANDAQALRPLHSASRGTLDGQGNPLDCHDRKTFRPRGGATTIGGDNYEAKKTDRMATNVVNKPPPGMSTRKQAKAWPTRRIVGRPFPPRGSRPMNRKRRA